ncbi:MAG: hypothetical protein Q8J63_09975 [Candidatus Aquicultor sp.]|nr:hypothetical protein [Candidatus Aquicultor sp.]
MQINKEEIPIIKSGLEMKKKTLIFKLKQYKERLKKFEEKYNMSTREFLKKNNAGELGDEAYLLEWEYLADAANLTKQELKEVAKISL